METSSVRHDSADFDPAGPANANGARFLAFLAAAAGVVGPAHVMADEAALAAHSRNTFPWPARTLAVVAPGTGDEAAACAALAGRHGVPIHPISRGRAWGLSGASPPRDAVVLDLSRLDRILDIDLAAGSVRVEPGVTFAAIHAELERLGATWHLPAFGGPPDASVLANALDRGEGDGAHGDRYAQIWDLDVALSTGERFRTGYGRYGASGLETAHARPGGPLLEGLFSQSGFGCILSARLGLAPNAAFTSMISFEVGHKSKLAPFLAALKGLLRDGVIEPHDAFLWDNAKRLASITIRSAYDEAELAAVDMAGWSATVSIRANHELLRDTKRAVAMMELAPHCEGMTTDEESDEAGLNHRYLSGFSDGRNVTSCYWAKAAAPPDGAFHPPRDRCGFLWICPALPLDGRALELLSTVSERAAEAFGVFVMTGVEAVSARALHGYVSLAWDRDEPGADERAMGAHAAIAEAHAELGFHAYRPTWPGLAATAPADPTFLSVLARVRAALDPGGVMAPGRVAGL